MLPLHRRVPHWVYLAAAAVLLLAAGIQVGRMMGPKTQMADGTPRATPDSLGPDSAAHRGAEPDASLARSIADDDGSKRRPPAAAPGAGAPREPERDR